MSYALAPLCLPKSGLFVIARRAGSRYPLTGAVCNHDPNIELFEVATPDGTRFLQSSPEYAMKRLLASGSAISSNWVRCLDPASMAAAQSRIRDAGVVSDRLDALSTDA